MFPAETVPPRHLQNSSEAAARSRAPTLQAATPLCILHDHALVSERLGRYRLPMKTRTASALSHLNYADFKDRSAELPVEF
jgi:hypothetical protein